MYKATIQAGCRASVCVKRNQVKVYNSTSNGGDVYLQDGQEFEIELYNPTQKTVAAKIILNGIAQQHSIVLKPGQRAYIERYPDEPKKFKFDTYVVDNTSETQEAIANNGTLRVEFYDEYIPPVTYTNNFFNQQYPFTFTSGTALLRSSSVEKGGVGPMSFQSRAMMGDARLSNNIGASSVDWMEQTASLQEMKETGRIEKGARSNQNFSSYSGSFNTYYTWTTEFKLLPLSQKPLEVKDLAQYCTDCGTKNKKGWKFCPSCGNKY